MLQDDKRKIPLISSGRLSKDFCEQHLSRYLRNCDAIVAKLLVRKILDSFERLLNHGYYHARRL